MDNLETIPFDSSKIRKTWYKEQWYFSIVDVIGVLTDSPIPRTYWSKLKAKILAESGNQLNPNWVQLKMLSTDGKIYKTDATNTEGILRIVMSVPSPKAEPLKLWLAQTGYERIQETENPELGFERMKAVYRAKGYTEEWIKERMNSIQARNKLTDEWSKRGVKEGQEFGILTAIIAKETFDVTPSEHKEIKGLTKPSQNLRDHMTDLELVLMTLGEVLTRTETIKNDAQGFNENAKTAKRGGSIAGKARVMIEEETGKKVVSKENFLKAPKKTDGIGEGE